MTCIFFPGETFERGKLGGKGGALADLTSAGFPVPPWFVISPPALERVVPEGDTLEAAQLRLLEDDHFRGELAVALARLSPAGEPVAVRSSALDEDGAEHSFAGQLDSYLFVPPDRVAEKVAAVWLSGWSDRVLAYRRERGLASVPALPAVLVQRMVHADRAGVAFSADPVSGRRGVAVVSGVYGLGTALVSGECDADTWLVDRFGAIMQRAIAEKNVAHSPAPGSGEGVECRGVDPGVAKSPSLEDPQVRGVAELARRAARHFGTPQDVEWAVENGCLYLLQSRPITSLSLLPDPDGSLTIWDNSNIVESYGGVTTPLTFSFARHIYEEVYRQFCRIMAVPAEAISANEAIFPRMLGLVRGRVYYNLLNWYRLLALFPGFASNRRFMEQMMGVKEGIPPEILAEAVAACRVGPLRDRFNLGRSLAGLLMNLWRLPATIERFYGRLNLALAPTSPPLTDLRPDELVAHYRHLEARLLRRWDAPLVNDFFAMIFYGLLRKLTAEWCGDGAGTLQNDLLSGEGGIVSAEPARLVRAMAEIAAEDQALTELLAAGDPARAQEALRSDTRLGPLYGGYLERFGDRCLDELKLESATLHDDPFPLLRAVGEFARRLRSGRGNTRIDEGAIRLAAEERVRNVLGKSPMKRLLFSWVLGQARGRVRERENLRFERTRLFGRVRRIFVELGKRLAADGILNDPRDIFWLAKEEIFGFVDGTAVGTDLRGVVVLRRAEFQRWRTVEPPPDHFETRGMVGHAQACRAAASPQELPQGDLLRGLGCCPGIVRGPVRVITDPRGACLRQGEILVAERTDPGWIMLFPACSGLLVERGSLLSHSAIVAREMGIPAVVSLAGVTAWLADGDWVEMDGALGTVTRMDRPETAHAE